MTDVEKQKIEAEIDELRSRIRSQLAQEHNWAEQERNWQSMERNWQAQQQNWQAQQQNWQSIERLNSIRNYILVAGIAAATGATLGAALMGALL